MKNLVVFSAAIVCLTASVPAASDVFSDAVIWRRGFTGSGLIPKESSSVFPEALKMGMPSDPSHKTIVRGVHSCNGQGVQLRRETVRYPYANFEQEETVAYFAQVVEDVTGGTAGYFSALELASPFVISNMSDLGYTFFVRFRWDGTLPGTDMKDSTVRESYFLNAGWEWGDASNKGTGILVGVGENGAFRLGEGSLWHILTDSSGKEVCVPANKWIDCAVTVQSKEFRLYAYWDGAYGAYLKKTKVKALNASSLNPNPESISASRCVRVGGIRGARFNNDYYNGRLWWNSVQPNDIKSFRGSIHSLVGWPRALNEYEIRQVFAYPKMDLVRLGTLNGNSGEFGGDGAADVMAGESDSHAKMPSALTEECDCAVIKFSVPAHLAGINQILRVTSPSNVASGSATVVLNGQEEGELRVSPGRTTAFLLKGAGLKEGVNTLELKHTSGIVAFDALSLGGGLQIGYANNAHSEFEQEHADYNTYYAEHEYWKHFGRSIRPSHNDAWRPKSTTYVNYSDDIAGRMNYRFRMTARISVGGGRTQQLGLYVNGKHLGSKVFQSDKGFEDFSLDFLAADLVPGKNEFLVLDETQLESSDTNYGWVSIDCIRIEPMHRDGFSVIVR